MDDLPKDVQFTIYDYIGAALVNAFLRLGIVNPRYAVVLAWRASVRGKGAEAQLASALEQVARNGDEAGFEELLQICGPLYNAGALVRAALEGAGDRRGTRIAIDNVAKRLIGLTLQSQPQPAKTTRGVVERALAGALDAHCDDETFDFLRSIWDIAPRPEGSGADFPSSENGPVAVAFAIGRVDRLTALLDRGFERPQMRIWEAAERGHAHICDWLLAGGADPMEALAGAVSEGQTELVRHLDIRWSETNDELMGFANFFEGAAEPAHRETLAVLRELGWFRDPAGRAYLLIFAFGAANAGLVSELLEGVVQDEPEVDRLVDSLWPGLLNCAARGGLEALRVGLGVAAIRARCHERAQALLSALLGGLDPGARARYPLAPPRDAIGLVRELRRWGANVTISCVRNAALNCSRALFLEAVRHAPEVPASLGPEILVEVARDSEATVGRMAMLQAALCPQGIPHRTLQEIAALQILNFDLEALVPLVEDPSGLIMEVGMKARPEMFHVPLRAAAAFARAGARLGAISVRGCFDRPNDGVCLQAELLGLHFAAPGASADVIDRSKVSEARWTARSSCQACVKILTLNVAWIRERVRKRKQRD